jgi:hypothetical protein
MLQGKAEQVRADGRRERANPRGPMIIVRGHRGASAVLETLEQAIDTAGMQVQVVGKAGRFPPLAIQTPEVLTQRTGNRCGHGNSSTKNFPPQTTPAVGSNGRTPGRGPTAGRRIALRLRRRRRARSPRTA